MTRHAWTGDDGASKIFSEEYTKKLILWGKEF